MSGYPNRTTYDATQKRKKYLEELELRARLDDDNLQANKLYKRTGAISTPPDTRTTSEKLADTYRLRIEIRSKLGQLMSGDDAQKVVNGLDQQELVFLAGRLDKYIADLKPKYSMGMPYQAFNAYLQNAVSAYLSLGDIDLSTATLLQNMITPDDLDRVLNQVEQMTTSYEQKSFQGLSMMYKSLMNGIDQTTKLITNGVIIDPTAIQDIQQVIQDAQQNIPNSTDLQQLKDDIEAYNTGFFNTEGERQQLLLDIRKRLKLYEAIMGTLKNDTEKIREETKKITERKTGTASSKVGPSVKIYKNISGESYIPPDAISSSMTHTKLKDYIRASKSLADQNPQDKSEYTRLKFKITASKDEIINKLLEPEVNAFMERLWTDFLVAQQTTLPSSTPASQLGLGSQLGGVKLKKATGPVIDPTLLVNLNQQQQSGSTNLTGTSPPSRPSSPTQFSPYPPAVAPSSTSYVAPLSSTQQPSFRPQSPIGPPPNIPFDPTNDFADELIAMPQWNDVYNFYMGLNNTIAQVKFKVGKYKTPDGEVIPTLYKYGSDRKADKNGPKLSLQFLLDEINQMVEDEAKAGRDILVPIAFDLAIEWIIKCISNFDDGKTTPKFLSFYTGRRIEILGSGAIPLAVGGQKTKRMKGGSVRIDVNAGMRDDTNVPKYVPFGRYIINRNKLNDGVIMIKRQNGSFMGDIQSRRVSNKLKNVFDKIIGGAIPSYQDFAKLDEDEKQYLHYVSKKANLLDKLNVPTPNKDEEEKMTNRFEILRGQLVAGNDNRELIKEFKKLILDMSDKQLLPRRQVSEILIDIEKTFS